MLLVPLGLLGLDTIASDYDGFLLVILSGSCKMTIRGHISGRVRFRP